MATSFLSPSLLLPQLGRAQPDGGEPSSQDFVDAPGLLQL